MNNLPRGREENLFSLRGTNREAASGEVFPASLDQSAMPEEELGFVHDCLDEARVLGPLILRYYHILSFISLCFTFSRGAFLL